MHAHRNIHAVRASAPFSGSLAAAVSTPDFRSIKHLLAKADLDLESRFLTNGGPITIAELDARLAKLHMSSVDRIALKATLGRLGLIKE